MANITGTANDDILPGTTLDDFINGLGGRDTITAGDGKDIIIGGLGADTIFAGNGDDEIWGGGGEWAAGEVIDGGAGNNGLYTWGGDISNVTITNVQTLGTHLNTLSLKASQLAAFSALIAYDGPLMLQATEAGTYSLQGKSVTGTFSITGSSGNDYLAGNSAAQTLASGDGNDRLQGLGGADILLGGNGDDEFLTGFTESPAGETIDGGAGFNTISSWNVDLSNATVSNVQKLNAALDRVTLTSTQLAGFTTLTTGSAQIDLIAAGAGTYSLQGKSVTGKFNVIGSTGNDYLAGNGAAQTLTGGNGNDVLQGAGGADVMLGGDGDDEFLTGFNESANETIDGGAGNNTLSSWNADLSTTTITNIQTLGLHLDRVTVTADQWNSFSRVIAYDGPFAIYAATPGAYRLWPVVNAQSYSFVGTSGNDTVLDSSLNLFPTSNRTISTGAGDDILLLGMDNDTIYAGSGNDVIHYGGGADIMYGEDGDDGFTVSAAPPFYSDNYTIDGGSGYNTLTSAGDDISSASIYNIQELLLSFEGVTLTADQIDSFSRIDAIDGSATIRAASAGLYDLSYKTGGTDSFSFFGTSGQDTFIGSQDPNYIEGSNVNADYIEGGNGDDALVGWSGNDTIYGGEGNDLISAGRPQYSADGSAIYFNTYLYGGDGHDFVFADNGDDYIEGGAGDDYLQGLLGMDTIIGGSGNDTYVVSLTSNETDHIQSSIIENDSTVGNVDFLYTAALHTQLWFTRSGDDLVIQTIGTSNTCTIEDWYLGDAHHVEDIRSGDGKALLDSQVQNLVNAMAAFTVPTTTTLPPEYSAVLDPIIAANWT